MIECPHGKQDQHEKVREGYYTVCDDCFHDMLTDEPCDGMDGCEVAGHTVGDHDPCRCVNHRGLLTA